MPISGDILKKVMRHWVSGVSVVTSSYQGVFHGLTANSFTSISLKPPLVSVTINNHTRSFQMITDAGYFGITILSDAQQDVSDRFSGINGEDRFKNLDVFTLSTGAPMICGGLAYLDCNIVYSYGMPDSTLFIGEVVTAQINESLKPLLYYNKEYRKL